MRQPEPVLKDLVLVGGGHSHALVLRMLGMRPVPGLRVTLVTDVTEAPYSGMVPGYVGGYYTHEDVHIDLRRLCEFAGAQLVHAPVAGVDLAAKRVLLHGHPSLGYDLLSINTGSTPDTGSVPGAAEHAVPAKPVAGLLAAWDELVAAAGGAGAKPPQKKLPLSPGGVGAQPPQKENPLSSTPHAPTVVLVGAGAGGVELALAMRRRLGALARLTIVDKAPRIVPTHASGARRRLTAALCAAHVELVLGVEVARVDERSLLLADGRQLPFDRCFWVTQASPAPWLAASGLAVDAAGFVRVDATLRSVSHPDVFAAGDVATIDVSPRPRSGVFAVRAAKPLAGNLRRALTGRPLVAWQPQRRFLSLIGTGDGSAVASWGPLSAGGPALWRLKDRIDRRFMERFSGLAPMALPAARPDDPLAELKARAATRCLGCAAKVGGDVLSAALGRIRADLEREQVDLHQAGAVRLGLAEPDDAAVLRVPPGRELVQSVDFLPALVSDPYTFGRIVAAHAFSDVFAMGGEPLVAQALVTLPYAAPAKTEEQLYQLLSGVLHGVRDVGAVLVGGHTSESSETALGLAVSGLVDPARVLRKAGLVPGQALVLTKAVGTGTLFAAAMRLEARTAWLDAAVASMLRPSGAAVPVLRAHGVTALTDVTGFGLLGHLAEMARASRVGVEVELAAVPLLPGAVDTVGRGIRSTLDASNRKVGRLSAAGGREADPAWPLLFDPQTSGGLLAGVPAEAAEACVAALRAAGYPDAAVVGRVVSSIGEGEDSWLHVH